MNREPGESALERLQRLELATKAKSDAAGQQAAPNRRPKRGIWGSLVAAAALLLGKLKFLLGGLKLLSLAKLATTSATSMVELVVYAQFFGWRFAALFLLIVLV